MPDHRIVDPYVESKNLEIATKSYKNHKLVIPIARIVQTVMFDKFPWEFQHGKIIGLTQHLFTFRHTCCRHKHLQFPLFTVYYLF